MINPVLFSGRRNTYCSDARKNPATAYELFLSAIQNTGVGTQFARLNFSGFWKEGTRGQHYPLSASFSNQSVLVLFDSFGVQCACRCRCRCRCSCRCLVGVRLTERRERIPLCWRVECVGLTLTASLSDGRTVRVSFRLCRRLGLAPLSPTTKQEAPPFLPCSVSPSYCTLSLQLHTSFLEFPFAFHSFFLFFGPVVCMYLPSPVAPTPGSDQPVTKLTKQAHSLVPSFSLANKPISIAFQSTILIHTTHTPLSRVPRIIAKFQHQQSTSAKRQNIHLSFLCIHLAPSTFLLLLLSAKEILAYCYMLACAAAYGDLYRTAAAPSTISERETEPPAEEHFQFAQLTAHLLFTLFTGTISLAGCFCYLTYRTDTLLSVGQFPTKLTHVARLRGLKLPPSPTSDSYSRSFRCHPHLQHFNLLTNNHFSPQNRSKTTRVASFILLAQLSSRIHFRTILSRDIEAFVSSRFFCVAVFAARPSQSHPFVADSPTNAPHTRRLVFTHAQSSHTLTPDSSVWGIHCLRQPSSPARKLIARTSAFWLLCLHQHHVARCRCLVRPPLPHCTFVRLLPRASSHVRIKSSGRPQRDLSSHHLRCSQRTALMFRSLWSSERGSETTISHIQPMPSFAQKHQFILPQPAQTASLAGPSCPQKRRLSSVDDSPSPDALIATEQPLKRAKLESTNLAVSDIPSSVVSDVPASASLPVPVPAAVPAVTNDMEDARDAIQYQFGLEILLKHNELRLINQELAKCQVALEQLRRCHLIPYPTACPTPAQMLDISNGKGPALQNRPGEPVPQWAAPFGVVDGPYARHYAKWLIPDPKFDGMQPEWYPVLETARSRSSVEGRTTRNSMSDLASANKNRSTRGIGSQKLQSLSSGYPQPKEKAGPCVLKRSDGQTVKLVCLDCNRENFSSTQGFINHCRIAHRRDFKSHEEAAVHCGHPIEVNEGGSLVGEEKAPPPPSTAIASGLVHPFAQTDMSTQQAYVALRSRIADSLKLYRDGKLPGVTSIPQSTSKAEPARSAAPKAGNFVASADTPFLSRLMQSRNFTGNLSDIVSDAKEKMSLEDLTSPGEESEDIETGLGSPKSNAGSAARMPAMRMPARAPMSPVTLTSSTRPTSSKGRSPSTGFASPPMSSPEKDDGPTRVVIHSGEDVDMEDVDLSPSTMVSNNAPSLVSDDGEYDDSDDGSSESGVSDRMDAESVSDVAEITLDEDHDGRPLGHHRESSGVGSGTAMRLKKDENKHVTFVSPVHDSAKRARKV
ncbi:uncharacterized protein CLUP02_10575 [Colletotrichum lupini]|uniref:AHC1-like C2H2 zinc-finger domain-containing protein n=1 Tax=Colletotrichum lupini TaxID=145971 RepID=A0A9Q8SWV0_9PEZI|nr:uncharacterized protein CLUP02_10575 [Colletotrichum lupini]UQC85079.1 hypothetical protein CLUP02_10575 [Colletotrichum lupini]